VRTVYGPYPHGDQEWRRDALPVAEAGGGILVGIEATIEGADL
jgi:hypothetical protein